MPDFEWDAEKSKANTKKHGISFAQATEIWNGVHLTVDDIARSRDGERRGAAIGWVGDKLYTAIWTVRAGRTRLISVRRARDGETEAYYAKALRQRERHG